MGPHNKSGEVAGLPNSAAGRQSSALREGRARMAAEAHNGGCSPRYWLLMIAALVVAALFSGAAYAAVLDSREAEQMTLGTGAAISGSHVILNATGERVTWVDGGAAGGTSVTATARHNGKGTSRVGWALYVNGVNRGSQFWDRSVTANAERRLRRHGGVRERHGTSGPSGRRGLRADGHVPDLGHGATEQCALAGAS